MTDQTGAAGTFWGFRSRYHALLAIGYGIIWLIMAIDPVYRADWYLENMLIVAAVALLWRIYHRFPLSNLSYTLIVVFMIAHTYGAHYTYAETPLGDYISGLFGAERNHYDRIIHFAGGVMIYVPMREVAERAVGAKPHWVDWIALLFIAALSALYESIEWVAAIVVAPEAAIAFLGSQGDLFDAQKDHALAILGALIAFGVARNLARSGKLPEPS